MNPFDCCLPRNNNKKPTRKQTGVLLMPPQITNTKTNHQWTNDDENIEDGIFKEDEEVTCQSSISTNTNNRTTTPTPTPVPPSARKDDIEALVETILKDKSINISMIPDAAERIIYKSTIQLTLNTFYGMISNLEGTNFMAHQIHLNIERGSSTLRHTENNIHWITTTDDDNTSSQQQEPRSNFVNNSNSSTNKSSSPSSSPSSSYSDVDDEILETVAERLLLNKTINQHYLPDQLEKVFYTNCLKVVFRVLDILTSSLRITVCGHDIGLYVQPTTWQDIITTTSQARSSSSSLSEIDQVKIRNFAIQQAGITEDVTTNFWDSLFIPKELLIQLHTSLYTLILGILDDMLTNTKIEILSDTLSLDIIPQPQQQQKEEKEKATEKIQPTSRTTTTSKSYVTKVDKEEEELTSLVQDPRSICHQMESIGFEKERNIILERFQTMTLEQQTILLRDLNSTTLDHR